MPTFPSKIFTGGFPGTVASAASGPATGAEAVSSSSPADPGRDVVYAADASGGVLTLSLPALSAVPVGRAFGVKKVDATANAVTVAPAGADTIDGGPSLQLTGQNESATVIATPSGWKVID